MEISHFFLILVSLTAHIRGISLKNSDLTAELVYVNKTVAYQRFYIEPEPHKTFAVYSRSSSENVSLSDPLEFLVREEGWIRQWQIPSPRFPAANSSKLTLCPPTNNYIDVALPPPGQTDRYSFLLKKVQYDIKSGESWPNIRISPTAPAVFRFELQGDMSYLLTIRNETEAVCTLVSVQPAVFCPHESLPHLESQVMFGKYAKFQTMLQKAALVINPKHFPGSTYLNIVVIPKTTDEGCSLNPSTSAQHTRQVSVRLSIEPLEMHATNSIIAVIVFYVAGCLMAAVLSWFCFRFNIELDSQLLTVLAYTAETNMSIKRRKDKEPTERGTQDNIEMNEVNGWDESAGQPVQPSAAIRTDDVRLELSSPANTSPAPFLCFWQSKDSPMEHAEDETDGAAASCARNTRNPLFNQVIRSRHATDNAEQDAATSSQQQANRLVKKVLLIDKAVLKKNRSEAGSRLRLSDMCVYFYDNETFQSSIHMRSSAYLWMTLLMGIFYTLPVFQLVLHYQETTLNTGNLDICYYNFKCMYPLMGLEDFGHIFSNIGYIISGIFFVLIVWIRSKKFKRICEKSKDLDTGNLFHPNNCSIPEQYGIFFAMGTALAFEGILSGCYHICPTAKNFQFDTTFMYAIAVLLFLKVYQFRHPDITQTAHLVFLVIGIALVFEVIGYYTDNLYFWIIFVGVYLIIIFFFIVHIFTNGKVSLSNIFNGTFPRQFFKNPCQKIYRPTLFVVFVNIILAAVFLFQQNPGVSRYLLIITMSNMALYVLYYIGRKLWYRFRATDWIVAEGIRTTTITYGLLSIGCMAGAVYYFKKELKSSALSPAESRDLNAECALGMFDNHDMWHFLSAAGLFYVFMFILTLEDANTGVPRNRIPVF